MKGLRNTFPGFLYIALAAFVLAPIFPYFSQAIIGGGDSVQNLWNLWWVDTAAQQGNWLPFQTNMLYSPIGVSLAFHPLEPVNGWLQIVLHHVLNTNLYTAYNLIVFFSFILTGIAAYALAYSLTGNPGAAFVAGIIFTFAPIRISRVHYGNLEMISTQWIPISLLFLWKMKESKSYGFGFLAATFLALTVWTSLYLALGTAILCGLVFLTDIPIQTRSRNKIFPWLSRWAISAGLVLVLSLPVMLAMIRSYPEFQDQSDSIEASISNSADLVGFFVPDPVNHPLLDTITPIDRLLQGIKSTYAGNLAEKTVFLGWTVLIFSALPFLFARSKKVLIWGAAAILFFLLCLGPVLHVFGRSFHIPVLYQVIGKIPLISFGRAPSRMDIFLMLSLSIWVAFGLAGLVRTHPQLRIIPWLVGMVIFMEFFPVHLRVDLRPMQISEYYQEIAQDTNPEHSVLDIPIDLYGAQGPAQEYMLYQTVHQKPIVSGYISRTPRRVMHLVETPFLSELQARTYGNQAPFSFDEVDLNKASDEICRLHVEYIIFHQTLVPEQDRTLLRRTLTNLLSEPEYEDDQVVGWQLSSLPEFCRPDPVITTQGSME